MNAATAGTTTPINIAAKTAMSSRWNISDNAVAAKTAMPLGALTMRIENAAKSAISAISSGGAPPSRVGMGVGGWVRNRYSGKIGNGHLRTRRQSRHPGKNGSASRPSHLKNRMCGKNGKRRLTEAATRAAGEHSPSLRGRGGRG